MTDNPERKPGNRPRLGPIDGDPVTSHPDLSKLSKQQQALRLAVIQEFKAKKVKKYVEKQVQYINANSRIADTDIAQSMSEMVRAQILQQAGISVLAQANQAPSLVLQLLK